MNFWNKSGGLHQCVFHGTPFFRAWKMTRDRGPKNSKGNNMTHVNRFKSKLLTFIDSILLFSPLENFRDLLFFKINVYLPLLFSQFHVVCNYTFGSVSISALADLPWRVEKNWCLVDIWKFSDLQPTTQTSSWWFVFLSGIVKSKIWNEFRVVYPEKL